MKDVLEKNNKLDNYLMIIATVFWSGAFIAGKFSVAEFPVFSLTFFRFFFAVITTFAIIIKKGDNYKIEKTDIFLFIQLGIIGMVGYHVFFFLALKYTTAVNSSLIAATNPIITTVLAFVFFKENIKPKNIISILASFLGVTLIITDGDLKLLANFHFNIGDLLMIIAVVCWAIYSVISKKALKKYKPIIVTSYSFLVCVISLIPFVIMEKPWVYLPNTSMKGWMSVLYMSIFASVIGYSIQQVSIKKIGASKTSLYINLVPVFSMILAYFILGESISIIKLVSAVLIISGVLLNTGVSIKKVEKESEQKN
ncbi:DMT family transporter [Tepidibacter aestuarii]|uniref:DMT family transporter n=1 Tax=Tepidibacter aestuarii TaxID=2925782 RepID=UPI0020BDBE8F|nr:DMT family transporter [Tepidibacter aestuarii]CAH2212054.1 Threonine/homoserine efflux transporter RhtA [Tepidibacter aestuarii]